MLTIKFVSKCLYPNGYKYRTENKPQRFRQLNTDEGYVAMSLLDAVAGKKSSILTGDTDYIHLLGVMPKILCSYDFHPYNQSFCDAVANNFPNLFYINQKKEEIELIDFDSVIAFIKSKGSVYMPEKVKSGLQRIWRERV